MAFEVKIPSLGESVSEAVIGHWIKQDGDTVTVDEPLLELESDKANMELAAEQAGVLRILRPQGDTVAVGDVVATIESGAAERREAPAAAAKQDGGAAKQEQAPAEARPVPQASKAKESAPPPPAPAASAPAPSRAPAPTAPSASAVEPRLSPAVRRIVSEENLDVDGVAGTGPGGRLTKADVLELAAERRGKGAPPPREEAQRAPETRRTGSVSPIAAQASAEAAPASAPRPSPPPLADAGADEERVPMSRFRQVIARRLVDAQHTAAILTTFNEVDLSAVLELRQRYKDSFKAKHGIGLGFMSFFVKACCAAANEVRELNAEIQGTDILYRRHVHMGVAVGSDRGLVVPVVRNADRLSFGEIEKDIARLAALARDGKLAVDDLAGATFTISNGGVYGSLLSTPILTPPQSGILGMHKIEKRPVVVDDKIEIRPMMYLALSYDHRIVDGKGAVTFLVHVKEALEDPSRLLLGV